MSSETSTDQLQPWQLFTLAGLAGATAVVFVTRDGGPAGVILLSLTVGAAAFVGLAAWRTLVPLAGTRPVTTTEVLGGRTRAALEREKTLVLRAIKDLEFDRAMGKVAEKDFAEMGARLRLRATGLIRQLDRGTGYRDEIEKEVAKRIGGPGGAEAPRYEKPPGDEPSPAVAPNVAPSFSSANSNVAPNVSSAAGKTCACGTPNDADAKFCKHCGAGLEVA